MKQQGGCLLQGPPDIRMLVPTLAACKHWSACRRIEGSHGYKEGGHACGCYGV